MNTPWGELCGCEDWHKHPRLHNTLYLYPRFPHPATRPPQGKTWTVIEYTFTLSTYLFPFVGPRLCPWGVLLLCNWITSVGLCVTDDPCLPSLAQTQDRRRRFLQDVLGCPSFRLLISQWLSFRLAVLQRWHFSTLWLLQFQDFGCPFANKGVCKYNLCKFCNFLPIYPRNEYLILYYVLRLNI